MGATSRLWLAIVAATNLVSANVASTIARQTEGQQEQLKQGFAAKLFEERTIAAEIEERELHGGGVELLPQPMPLHTAMLGMFKAQQAGEEEGYGEGEGLRGDGVSSTSGSPLPSTSPPPPAPLAVGPDEDESTSTSALSSTRMPASSPYASPAAVSWVTDDDFNPAYRASSAAPTAAPTAEDTTSIPWSTPEGTPVAPRPTATENRTPFPTPSPRDPYASPPTGHPVSVADTGAGDTPLTSWPTLEDAQAAPSPTAAEKRTPFPTPGPRGPYPSPPTEPPVSVAVPIPSLPTGTETRSPSSPPPAPGMKISQSPAAWKTSAPSRGVGDAGNSTSRSPPPSPAPASPATEAGRPTPSPERWTGAPAPAAGSGRGGEFGSPSPATIDASNRGELTSDAPTPTGPPVSVGVPIPSPIFGSNPEWGERGGTTTSPYSTSSPTPSSTRAAASAAPTQAPTGFLVDFPTSSSSSSARPRGGLDFTFAPTSGPSTTATGGAPEQGGRPASATGSPTSTPTLASRGGSFSPAPASSPSPAFGGVGSGNNTAAPTASPPAVDVTFGPTGSLTEGGERGRVPLSAAPSAAPSSPPAPRVENSASPSAVRTNAPSSGGQDTGTTSSSPTAAPSTSLVERGGGATTAAPSAAGRTASPTASVDRGFAGETVAPALPWLETEPPTPSPSGRPTRATPQPSTSGPTSSSAPPSPAPTNDGYAPRGQSSPTASPSPTGDTPTSRGRSSSAPSASPTAESPTSRGHSSSAPSASPTGDTPTSRGQPSLAASPAPSGGSDDAGEGLIASSAPSGLQQSSVPTPSPGPGSRDFTETASPTGAGAGTATPSPLSPAASASPTTALNREFGKADPRSSAPSASPSPGDNRGFTGTSESPAVSEAPTGAATVPPSPPFSASASPTTVDGGGGFGGADPVSSSAPTASPSSGGDGRDFAVNTASPTMAADNMPPSPYFSEKSASPTTSGNAGQAGQPTASSTLAPAAAHTAAPGPPASPTSSGGGDDREAPPTAAPSAEATGFGPPTGPPETPAPSVSYLTLVPTPSSDGQRRGDDDGLGVATSSPSAAPTFGIDGDIGGVDRGITTPPPVPAAVTPAPTDRPEDLWNWWFQAGSPRADRGQALVRGAGDNSDRRYLVGTEDGAVVIDPATSSDYSAAADGDETESRRRRRRRRRRQLQGDSGSGQDVSVICLSAEGEDIWHKNMGSPGEDVALCAGTSQDHIVIAGYTTDSLYSDNNGEDDAFLALLDPDSGDILGGWQFGGEGSERVYALVFDDESGDIIVGGYTTGSLFSTNDIAVSQFFIARLSTRELLVSPVGLLDLSDDSSTDAVVWGWQYSTPATVPEAIVSVVVDSDRGVVTALGSRGLPPEWAPRDPDFVPEDRDELSSVVLFLDLETGELQTTSVRLTTSLGTAVAVDEETGDAYVTGFIASSSDDESGDTIVVHKIWAETGAKGWSYAATAEGVSAGRALAISFVGESNLLVAGTTSGADAYPSAGASDIFSLVLSTVDGSETCYYQVGTNSSDVATSVWVANSAAASFPDVAIGGFTEGSLAGPSAGGTDIFAIGVKFASFCPDVGGWTSTAGDTEARGSFAAGAVSILAGVAIVGAVVSTVLAPAAAVSSAAAAAGSVAGAGIGAGVAKAPAMAAAGGGGGAVAATASACPAGGGGAGALVTILSAGHGAGGLSGNNGQPATPGEATFRSPSASIGLLVMMQLQFLALLSLVPSVHDSASFLSSFVENLRWVNLWVPMPSSLTPDSCEVADAEALMDDGVFFGNTALVFGVLLAIFALHVAVISAVEAYWLAQDRATAALNSAHEAYGMSATELAVQASGRGRSGRGRGRGRFSAVANADDGNARARSPGSPGGDLISFDDLGDADAQRLRTVFPAPASSVGSARSLSPRSGTERGSRTVASPASPSSCYADDLPSTFEESPPCGGGAAGDASGYSPPNSLSVWVDNQQQQQQQQPATSARSVSASPTRLSGGGLRNGSAFSRRDDWTVDGTVDSRAAGGGGYVPSPSPTKNGPVSWESRSASPPPLPGLDRPSSIVRRISDKGGGSLPCSPTRGGGGRYGGTDDLYPHQSAVSSVRSASPASLYWDSPPRAPTGDPNRSRGRAAVQPSGAGGTRSGEHNSGDHGGDGDGDGDGVDGGGFVDLFYIDTFMSGTAAGPRGIPPLGQETPAVMSDSGSAFEGGMVADPTTAGLRRRRGDNGSSRPEPAQSGTSIVEKPPPGGEHGEDDSHPILACRRRSRSMWLHFPHLELLFLFWAFEGAVAAQVSALKDAECPRVFWLALAALMLFPVLMVVMVWRTIAVRVRPNDRLVFRLYGSEGEQEGGNTPPQEDQEDFGSPKPQPAEDGRISPTADDDGLPGVETGRPQRGLWQKFVSAWFENGMLFSWADTGSWESVATNDAEIKREADWFRIGFEPLFVDLSKLGCFYLIFLLVKWFGLACVGVLVEDSVKQLLYMFILHAVDLAVLVRASPFANSVINTMNAMLTAVDCACTALMLVAAGFDEDETSTFNDIAFVLQLVALIALVIPVYIDTGVSLTILATEKLSQTCAARNEDEIPQTLDAQGMKDEQDREYVRRFARRSWPRYWCPMVRHNVQAAASDIREGIRAPGGPTTHRRRRWLRRHQAERLGKTEAPGKKATGVGLFGCCGVSAAPTLPVPSSVPNSCVGDEWYRDDGKALVDGQYVGGKQPRKQQQQDGGWALPPKLRAAGQGAGSWGGETALISSRSIGGAHRPPSPSGPGHHHGRGSEATLVAGSMIAQGQSGALGAGGGGGGGGSGGFGAGDGASGRGLISSVFCSAPVPVDEPRRTVFDTTGRSGGSLDHGGGSSSLDHGGSSSRGDSEAFAARGSGGASGRGLITSMFSTAPPVAMDDVPRKHVYGTGTARHSVGSGGGGGVEGFPDEEEEGGSSVAGRGEDGDRGRAGGGSGRGLFSGASPVPIAGPQRKTAYGWSGFAEARDEEDRGRQEAGAQGGRSAGATGGG